MVWKEQAPLVGRERELRTLERLLKEARGGRSGVVVVAGEPGIGKTRLLLEFAQRARAEDWHVLLSQAYDSEGMPPYLPFIEALQDYLRTRRPDEVRANLEGIAPDVLELLPDIVRGLAGGRSCVGSRNSGLLCPRRSVGTGSQ
jgi:predicted ATPase